MKQYKTLFVALLKYCLPLAITTVFLSVINLTDVGITARKLGNAESVGVGVGGQISYLFMNAGVGLSIGATIYISKKKGEGIVNHGKSALVAAVVCLTFGVLASAVLGFFPEFFIKLLATPAPSVPYAVEFLKISAIAVPLFCLFQCAVSVWNGLGDTVTPMLLTGGYAILNFGLTLLFSYKFATVKAVAFANVVALTLILIASAAVLIPNLIPKERQQTEYDWKAFLRLGVPLCLLNLTATLSFWGIARMVHTAPEGISIAQSGAHALVVRLCNFILLPERALATGISALTARAVGCSRSDYSPAVCIDGILMGLILGVPAFLFVLFLPELLLTTFGSQEFAEAGATYFRIAALDFLLLPFVSGVYGFTDGHGKTKITMAVNVVASIFVRLPLAYLFAFVCDFQFIGIAIALPLTTLFSLLIILPTFLLRKKKTNKVLQL